MLLVCNPTGTAEGHARNGDFMMNGMGASVLSTQLSQGYNNQRAGRWGAIKTAGRFNRQLGPTRANTRPLPFGPISGGTTLVMSTGALSLAGLAPKVPRIVQIPTGALTLAGLAPSIPRIIRPGTGQLVLAGIAPKIPRIVRPGTGQLVLAGLAVRPGTGQLPKLVLAGLAPFLVSSDPAPRSLS
jgi:hypothetical protein